MIGDGRLFEDIKDSGFSCSFRVTVEAQLVIDVVGVPLDGVGGKDRAANRFPSWTVLQR